MWTCSGWFYNYEIDRIFKIFRGSMKDYKIISVKGMSIDIFLLIFSFIFTPLLFYYNLVKTKEHKLHSRN